ncbi:MAG: ABC transporter substrate-binding protein, partial [Actinomycetota bacterium]|nr:ABC transporter substrate-binding protein [Actinomycetota bacterium]
MVKTFRLLALPTALLAAGAALTGCSNSSASTKDGTPTLKIMVGGLDKVIYLPAKLTEQLGYFKDAGVNVQLLSEPSGADAETLLIAKQVQGVVGFYDHTVAIQTKGKCLESVVQLSKAPGEVEVVAANSTATSFADFKGKKLGVTSPGSSTDFLTQALAVKAGLKTSDYTTVKAGAGDTFIAALGQGAINGGMTTDPTVARLVSSGKAKVLVDMRTEEGSKAALGGAYPSSSVYMDCAYVASHKDAVQRVANAMVKTLGWMSTHTPEEIAAKMPADYAGSDATLYASAIKATLPMFTTDGVMPDGGPETVLEVLGSFNP